MTLPGALFALLEEKGGVPPIMGFPFALLLVLIAAMPLSPPRIKQYWEHYYAQISIGLGLLVVVFYLWKVENGAEAVRHSLFDYISFISLIGSLFVIAGGIHIQVKDEATPLANTVFLAIAALLANLVGTTGASMVLIRPWIRMNKIRVSAYHVVFFIFIVSNVGGALTPVGDPPLFLGYLKGIPFFWLLRHVILQWFVTVSALLVVFYCFDQRSFLRAPPRIQQEIKRPLEGVRIRGLINLFFLGAVIGAVFLPERFFLREAVMLGAAAASYRFTAKDVHAENAFNFGPIKEVAFLFFGIFATMMPALDYIDRHGEEIAITCPLEYYVAAGTLSSVLDNAPTYATFLRLAQTSAAAREPAAFVDARGDESAVLTVMRGRAWDTRLIVAVSLGAVFFGAMTYIGNGPNFMVKAIAESTGSKTPSFFGYILKFSLPILLPILLLSGWLFL